jgi:hypothetical protein
MKKLLFALLIGGCAPSSDSFCTSAACAAHPCTPGCVFQNGGSCSSRVSIATVRACPGWCGLIDENPAGCLRYRSEDSACPTWCINYGGACWEQTPRADYSTGGAICTTDASCAGGPPPADLYYQCVDGGGHD